MIQITLGVIHISRVSVSQNISTMVNWLQPPARDRIKCYLHTSNLHQLLNDLSDHEPNVPLIADADSLRDPAPSGGQPPVPGG